MSILKQLKKELKEAKKELKLNKNVNENKDLIAILENEIKIKQNLKEKGYKYKALNKVIKKFEDYDINTKFHENIRYAGNNIVSFRFDATKYNGGAYSKDKLLNLSNKFSSYLKKKKISGKLMTTIKHPLYNWKSGYLTDIGNNLDIYDPSNYYDIEPDDDNIKYDSFIIYAVIKPKAEGGTDYNNDCLYICLKYYIFDIEKYFESPEKLKKYLGLKRDDKIPLNLIPKIEKKLSTYQINVRGDFVYTSTIKSNKIINLLLINQHYTIDKEYVKPSLNNNVRFYEKIPMLYDKLTFEGYDGTSKRKLSIEERNDILYNFKSKYILFGREEQKKNKLITMEEEYAKLIIDIELLKTESNGIINLYKTGNINNTCLELFDKMTKFLIEPDQILQDEAIWINESTVGSLIWAQEYNGDVYKYDVKSLYPYIMSSKGKFPIKRGEFQKLKTIDNVEYFQFGIYRVKITPSNDKHINKLFRFSTHNYYTHISLEHARKLKLKMELIQDDKPNFLFYSREKLISFEEVFKPYVMFLFDLKDKGVNKAKDILNRLWGKLGEYDRQNKYDDKEITINDDEDITELRPCNKNEDITQIKTNKINKPYKTNYARLIPFIKAKDRSYMSELMYDNRQNIHQILTDGFLCDKLIHTNQSVKLGELKYEGNFKNVLIKNCKSKV